MAGEGNMAFGELERALSGDHFLAAGPDSQIAIVSMFLSYLSLSEVNQRHHQVFDDFFLDWAASGDPHYASAKYISQLLKDTEDAEEWDEEDEIGAIDILDRMESDFLMRLDAYDPRCLLAAMQAIYAFLTPGTTVKPPARPGRRSTAKKQAKKTAKKY